MAQDFDTLLRQFQGNVYPAMLDNLASHLGVTADSLSRLGLGWCPIVTFKKGDNYQGWWVIPERDAVGDVIGLSLRSRDDVKVMYSGSKHGLIYEINPQHQKGAEAYHPGKHNWVRIADAGISCPTCDKPDGCLVAFGDGGDPKATVCIRVESTRPLRFGYLHVLTPEGEIRRGAGILPASDDPVIVVEGMTDTAAAMDLGFRAIGRPSNLACLDMLKDVARGQKVIILGENDQKPNGEKPGEQGMIAAFQSLKTVCPDIRMVMPPADVKDLRAWCARGLTREELLAYVEEKGQAHTPSSVLANEKPLTIAKLFLGEHYRMAGRYTLRNLKGQWFKFQDTKYREISVDQEVRGKLHEWLDDKYVEETSTKGACTLRPVHPSVGYLNNVFDGMNAVCPIYADPPCWVNGVAGPNPRDLIAFENGILHVPAYLGNERDYLLPPSPDFFTLAALPFPFDPTATCPVWKRYLRSALGDDTNKILLLKEWFGYCLTPDTTKHKLMFMQGPARSGKSTALRTLSNLVGGEQAATTSFAAIVDKFGLQSLVGKLVATMPEAVLPKTADSMQALQRLLSIVGEDGQNIPRKFLGDLTGHRLMCRFTLAANETPNLPDHAGALMSRLLILEYNTTFAGQEDFDLEHKLAAEVPGIAVWALEGLRRLRINGRFTMPASCKTALEEWRKTTSPLASFIEECCTVESDGWALKDELYDAWTAWSAERGIHPITKSLFKQRLQANAPTAISQTHFQDGHKLSVYRGLSLQKWAARKFLGRPN